MPSKCWIKVQFEILIYKLVTNDEIEAIGDFVPPPPLSFLAEMEGIGVIEPLLKRYRFTRSIYKMPKTRLFLDIHVKNVALTYSLNTTNFLHSWIPICKMEKALEDR
ncbi:hypothetical protein L2E82_30268 [Cichorium intybus]|uniref:Uncharacterized protein n=1 Tax=Cichorium intybus TaxID=13427 RepID=A0ACB9D0H5_CICIN|nr:hypothetical protein L2E82_30268 [Cichorium intybus]